MLTTGPSCPTSLRSPSLATGGRMSPMQALLEAVTYRATSDQTVGTSSLQPETQYSDASILLLGIRGTGKTSLAILASSCIGFRLVDADQHFNQTTKLTRGAYSAKYGFDDYKEKEISLLRLLLEQNPSRCIIVCGPGSAQGTGQELIGEFKRKHPVIYVLRDPAEIHQYLRTPDADTISRLTDKINPSYRAISNYEFYNLSENLAPGEEEAEIDSLDNQQTQVPRCLVLKQVEDDFLRLIFSIQDQIDRPRLFQVEHALSYVSLESKPFTYALQVPIETVPEISLRLRATDLVADAVELIINMDTLLPGKKSFDQTAATSITLQYYRLRRNVKLPIILHVHPPGTDDAQVWKGYFQLLYHGLRLAPEYMTVDLSSEANRLRTVMAFRTSTKIIGHYFDLRPSASWDSPDRLQVLDKAESLGCDLARLCQPATSLEDNIAAQHFVIQRKRSASHRIPIIAYNTGPLGRSSCFANSILTPVTQEILHPHDHPDFNHLLTVQQAQRALYASFILDRLVFGIIGNAVSAAKSPDMHNAAFEYCGMPHVYQTFQLSSLQDLRHLVYDVNFGGASISAPFKNEILALLDYVSPEAQAIGAVNTLIPLRRPSLDALVDRNHTGPVAALFGDNTDWIGIHTCIRKNLSPVNRVKARTTALILGAGGMARAAVYAALRLGVRNIFIHNRTPENAVKIMEQFNGKSFPFDDLKLTRASLGRSPPGSGITTPNLHTARPAQVRMIQALDDAWPSDFDLPTIIISCISRASVKDHSPPVIRLSDAWLSSPTGGVVIEVCTAYQVFTDTPILTKPSACLQTSQYTTRAANH